MTLYARVVLSEKESFTHSLETLYTHPLITPVRPYSLANSKPYSFVYCFTLNSKPYSIFSVISFQYYFQVVYMCVECGAFCVCVDINHIAEPLRHHRLRLVSVWTYLLHISVAWIRLNRAFICGHLARILHVASNISIIVAGRTRLNCSSMAIRFLDIE